MLVEKFFLSLLFLIPIIGLYSGLSVAGTVPVFLLSCLFYVRKFLEFRIRDNIEYIDSINYYYKEKRFTTIHNIKA